MLCLVSNSFTSVNVATFKGLAMSSNNLRRVKKSSHKTMYIALSIEQAEDINGIKCELTIVTLCRLMKFSMKWRISGHIFAII